MSVVLQPSYQLFVAGETIPLQTLSWHLARNETAPLPVAWIFLLGGDVSKVGKATGLLEKICNEVGKQLASTNYGVVTGMDMISPVLLGSAFNAFNEIFKSSNSPGNLKDYVRYYNLYPGRDIPQELQSGTTITINSAKQDRLYAAITTYPNAAIVIGGDDTTFDMAFRCLQAGRPVFPVVESGGAAKRLYDLLLEEYEYKSENSFETQFAHIKADLSKIYQHPLDVKALDQPFKSAIAEIISHLNMIFVPDDPRMYAQE